MAVTLSVEQEQVATGILTWLSEVKTKTLVLAGYAGTGKTTTIAELLHRLPTAVKDITAAVTYTGKASDVLSAKLGAEGIECAYVGTIHSLFYQPVDSENTKEEVTFERRDSTNKCDTGMVCKETLPCISITVMGAYGPTPVVVGFLIVDELSMIDEDIYNDLVSFNIPILFCGDNYQNGPINGGTAKRLTQPDFTLQEVHRQALNNPIVKVATDVRQGEDIPMGRVGSEFIRVTRDPAVVTPLVDKFIDRYFVQKDGSGTILCAKNSTRRAFNRRVREKLGCTTKYPGAGELVVCLRNNKFTQLKNGTLCMVTKDCTEISNGYGKLSIMNLQKGKASTVTCYLPTFFGDVDWEEARKDPTLHFFDFGYALTGHKAQGSEWDAVVLLNTRLPNQTTLEYTKWLYTAITRASKKLIMVG